MTPSEPIGTAQLYRAMSDQELLAVAQHYEDLTEHAQSALRLEFTSRAMDPPLIDPEDSEDYSASLPRLVTVHTCRDLAEAIVARSVLEAEGIKCFLMNENTIRQDWLWSNLLGGLRLQVALEQESAARSLLTQLPPATMEVAGQEDFHQPVCPRCGSLRVRLEDSDRKILAASLLIGLPIPHRRSLDAWKCENCGCAWSDDGIPEPSATSSPAPLR